MKKKTGLWLFAALLAAVSVSIFLLDPPQDEPLYADIQPDSGKGSNTISYGLYEPDGQIIDNGTVITPGSGNRITKVLSLSHFLEVDRKYGLVVLEDFKQVPFTIDGKTQTFYTFDMTPNQTVNVKIETTVQEGAQELDYLVIPKPEYMVKDQDIEKASVLQEALPLRFPIHRRQNSALDYATPVRTFTSGPNDNVFISSKAEELKILFQSPDDEPAYLSVGNIQKQDVDYALVAFMNWEQVPVDDQHPVLYAKVKPGERIVYPLQFPDTQTEQSYQIFAFPKPFQVDRQDYPSQHLYGTLRTIVQP
ncbi:hypothetical protein EV586_1042 [Tumebacillus sp. BK434]|uniref:hypothetical protein n=1 Tax=Tumebacillus sp. BK434 TaxID=2512169 RepID=UPI001047D1BF|nr:hypothetical protein [Tumebacillus sp. BK434]TCP54385.1 hypothetical protein EV586_1042 [Tumebacillus sp. BK434]